MNNKGFTLIETIVVIAIIAIISLILVPNITGLIKKNKNDSYNDLISSIERAASLYVSDNRYNTNIVNINCPSITSFYVSLKTLVDSGDLTSPIIDSRNNREISQQNNNVKVTFNCSTKQFTYKVSFSSTIDPIYQ